MMNRIKEDDLQLDNGRTIRGMFGGHPQNQIAVPHIGRKDTRLSYLPQDKDALHVRRENLLYLQEHDPDTIDIGRKGIRFATVLFGGGIEETARIGTGFCHGEFFMKGLGQTKIGNLDHQRISFIEKNVVGLDIPVDDAIGMQEAQPIKDLTHHIVTYLEIHLTTLPQIITETTFAVLHLNVEEIGHNIHLFFHLLCLFLVLPDKTIETTGFDP
jgi:hypothetical protein